MGVGSGFVICCQLFFACLSLVLYLSLYLHLITLYLFSRYFYTRPVGRGIIFDLLFLCYLCIAFSAERAVFFDMLIQKIHAVGCVLLKVWFQMSAMFSWQVPSVYFELFFLLALSSWAWRYPLVSIISFGRQVIAPSVSGKTILLTPQLSSDFKGMLK